MSLSKYEPLMERVVEESANEKHSSQDESRSSTDDALLGAQLSYYQRKRSFLQRHGLAMLVHICLLSFSIGLFVAANRQMNAWSGCSGDLEAYAHEAFEYESAIFDVTAGIKNFAINPYSGPPSEELDDAWNDLLQYSNVKVSAEKMGELGRTEQGVRLPDGSYFGTPMMYHSLHCVKRLHQYLYKDHYFPNATEHQHNLLLMHSEHCLDVLRQGAMCAADTTLVTMRWGHKQPIPLANFSSPHQCRNFKKIDDWMKNVAFDALVPGVITNPRFGVVFPDGVGDEIGFTEDF